MVASASLTLEMTWRATMPDTGRSNVRELRRIELPVGETGFGDPDGPLRVAVVVDVETTGLSPQEDKIIELAMRRFTYDPEGQIVVAH